MKYKSNGINLICCIERELTITYKDSPGDTYTIKQ